MCAAKWPGRQREPEREEPSEEWLQSLRGKPFKVARREMAAEVAARASVTYSRWRAHRDRWAWIGAAVVAAGLLTAVWWWR